MEERKKRKAALKEYWTKKHGLPTGDQEGSRFN